MPSLQNQEAAQIPSSISKNDHNKICKAFVQEYMHVANNRVDLLYRFYSQHSKLLITETVHGHKGPTEICASEPQEIRYLLIFLLSTVRLKVVSAIHQRTTKDHTLLFTNGVFETKGRNSIRYFFTRALMVSKTERGLTIHSETLQIYSDKMTNPLLNQTKADLEAFRKNPTFYFPTVVDRKFKAEISNVASLQKRFSSVRNSFDFLSPKDSKLSSVDKVGTLVQASCRTNLALSGSSAEEPLTRENRMATNNETLLPWGARGPEGTRVSSEYEEENNSVHTDLPESVSPLAFGYGFEYFSKRTTKPLNQENRLDTPMEEHLKAKAVEMHDAKTPVILQCLTSDEERVEILHHRDNPDDINEEKMVESSQPFLSCFGSTMEVDGPPVVWDLSPNGILTQLRTYQDVVEQLNMEVPQRRINGEASGVSWHERTVYLDNLPKDVHPESLRRAFEAMFGEIEEENGIIICSARRSSIAYVVFKHPESALAVGQSDSWIKDSKLMIQKYKASTNPSQGHPLLVSSRNEKDEVCSTLASDDLSD